MSSGARRRLFAVLAIALVVSLVLVSPASAVSYDNPHATVYTIDVEDNGDATWTIELRYQLVGEDDVEAFESIQNDFEEGNLSVFEGIEGEMASFAEEGSEATGRPMSVDNFERDIRVRDTVTQTVGVVSVSFRWNSFAEADSSGVRVGDAFVGSGLVLTSDERLVVELMQDIPLRSVSPEPDINDGDRLIWDGERFFEEGQPTVIFSDETGDETGEGNSTDDTGNPSQEQGLPSAATIVAGFLVLISGLVRGLSLRRKTGIVGKNVKEDEDIDDDEREHAATELLTDEDKVIRILEKNGGKMKQAEIVNETDWSKSKVSMLLSNMEEEGKISKLRLGRENVIELQREEQ